MKNNRRQHFLKTSEVGRSCGGVREIARSYEKWGAVDNFQHSLVVNRPYRVLSTHDMYLFSSKEEA